MKMVARIILLLFSAGLGSWAQAPTPVLVALPPGSAMLTDAKGEVLVTIAGQSATNAAYKGQVLGPNTTIECKKGSAMLVLSDGSQVLVKSNTRVVVRLPEEAKGNFLEQLIGKITATVKKRTTNDPPFKMGTPTAVITVRGTKFTVEVSKHEQTFVQVYEGIVQVESMTGGGGPLYLQSGYITRVERDRPPEAPRRLLEELEREGGAGSLGSSHKEKESDGHRTRDANSNDGGSEIDD
jgi:ferric-dicitrate binding protein FerR (iron transport regulator)